MAIEDVKRLCTVNDPIQAQRLLNEGWKILAVCVKQGDFDQFAEYHLGHTRPASIFDGLTQDKNKAVLEAAQGKVLGPQE
ncbi:hypothetical protein ACTACN_23520 [Pseudomonas syringae]|jgi:hypothetical protein|uniref:hypothetical protein n=1 Tax=Pseudomonas syringae TaxID=317 RepID=UPI00041B1301|nr:hypothetical protein [Pseudomonas syringae]PHN46966.1 hypothetical protein AO254_01255 [Pseudomonas syringae]RMM56456.1 hypothetical protein ALQ76_01193 [Pseudomonas syringae pv. atrofaciens]